MTWLATALWELTYKILPSFFGFFTSLKEIKVLLPKIGILAPSDTKIGVSKEFIVDFSQDFLLSANFLNSSKLRFLGKEEQVVKSKIKDKNGLQLPFICFDKKSELVELKSSFDILYNVNLNSFSGQDMIELTLREVFIKK